jgi:hypothetical protein
VTRDGAEVAELGPGHPALSTAELIERRRDLPKVDPDLLRRDVDDVLDTPWDVCAARGILRHLQRDPAWRVGRSDGAPDECVIAR